MNDIQTKHFDIVESGDGIVTVTLDSPGRPLNVFDKSVMGELDRIVTRLEKPGSGRAVVFRSGKESGFLAGADVRAIRTLDSVEHVREVLTRGQQLFDRVARLAMPTVAAIHGPCLGGGLEFALACDYRVARDNSSTQLGLPEIKLGLIPGWGGTQRLPRVVGITLALEMILRGRSLSADEALRAGLIDRAIGPPAWTTDVDSFVREVSGTGKRAAGVASPPQRTWLRLIDANPITRAALFRLTARKVASRSRHYPALPAAIRAVRAGLRRGVDGYARERDEFVRLWATATSKHLIDLFLSREAARNLNTWAAEGRAHAHDQPVRKIGVVGAGEMGAGIGQLAAYRGFDVRLLEVDERAADAGRKRIETLFGDLAKRKRWSDEELGDALSRVSVGCDRTALGDRDLVIEAVVERESVKCEVFRNLDESVQRSAILATNTSSLSVDAMAGATRRREKVAGLHFFNPVHRMELVEVVRGSDTDDATVARAVSFVRALGKTPVVTADAPGFLVNRILFPYLGEAVMMVRERVGITKIDRQVRRFGMPMGPLELLDQVGLDVALHVARSLRAVLGEAAAVIDPLAVMTEHDRLGKKSGRGFYRYRRGKQRKPAELPKGFPLQYRPASSDRFVDDGLTLTQQRAVYPMLAEAVRCLEQGVVAQPWMVDLAMVLGTGFAPHTGGPLHLIDAIGADMVVENLDRLAAFYGNRFSPPDLLREMASERRRFFDPETAGRQETSRAS